MGGGEARGEREEETIDILSPSKWNCTKSGSELQSPLSVAIEDLGSELSFVPGDHHNGAHLDIKALLYEHRHVLMSYYSL